MCFFVSTSVCQQYVCSLCSAYESRGVDVHILYILIFLSYLGRSLHFISITKGVTVIKKHKIKIASKLVLTIFIKVCPGPKENIIVANYPNSGSRVSKRNKSASVKDVNSQNRLYEIVGKFEDKRL